MSSFLSAVVAMIVISIGASFVLERFQKSAAVSFHTVGVRLDPAMGMPAPSALDKPHQGAEAKP